MKTKLTGKRTWQIASKEMVQLTTQKQIRHLKKLPFCYACGKEFGAANRATDDHVPPKTCFAIADRNFPLELPAHWRCNNGRSDTDETIGQVIALKHAETANPKIAKLKLLAFGEDPKKPTAQAITNVDIRGEIRRYIRGFHAALYQQPLSLETQFAIETPFPLFRLTPEGPQSEALKLQHVRFVETIKLNRIANNLDAICTNNGKLRYECVWDQTDRGPWLCIFALNIYEWRDLGDINNFPARGCAGSYIMPSGDVPPLATRGTKLFAQFSNRDKLDPFGD